MRKKKLIGFMLGTILMIESYSVMAKSTEVYINGNKLALSQPLIIENGITYVPAREISEALGATVTWDSNSQLVVINLQNSRYAHLYIGSKTATTSNGEVVLQGAARISNATTYVPLRFVSEALGAEVEYEDKDIYINATNMDAKINNSAMASTEDYLSTSEMIYNAAIEIKDVNQESIVSKKLTITYNVNGVYFVPLKEVQKLVEGLVFNQSTDGETTLSYNGKTIKLTKEDYSILDSTNMVMINDNRLEELGMKTNIYLIQPK